MTMKSKLPDRIRMIDIGIMIDSTLVIADTHIGLEEALAKQGMLVPVFQWKDLERRISGLIEAASPKWIIIDGDIKHEFGTISDTEWKHTLRLLDLMQKTAQVTLIKGNHDTIIGPIAGKRDIEVRDSLMIGDIFITHGHRIDVIPRGTRTIVIGHEHPAISLKTRYRQERFKCFLVGRYKRYQLIVLPSCNLVTEGSDILKEEILSPYLRETIRNMEVYIVPPEVSDKPGEPLFFGPAKNLLRNIS